MRRADAILGGGTSAVGVGALIMACHMPFYANGIPGPGFFPVLCSSGLVVLGVILAIQSLFSSGIEVRAIGSVTPTESRRRNLSGDAGSDPKPMRSAAVCLGYAVSVPMLAILGFVPAMALLVAYLLFVVERRRGIGSACAVVIVPIATYLVFVNLLGIQLPTGMLGIGVLGM